MIQFTDIGLPEFPNAGGANTLFFVDVDTVQNSSFDNLGGYVVQPIQLEQGKVWLKVNAVKNSISFTETPRQSSANTLFQSSVSGIIAQDKPERMNQLSLMEKRRFIVLLKNKNSEWVIIGSPDEPAKFTYNQRSWGQTAKDRPQYEFRFEVTRRVPAPFLRTFAIFYWNNQGQLVFDNTFDPTLSASVDANGTLTITGPNADKYEEIDGVFYYNP